MSRLELDAAWDAQTEVVLDLQEPLLDALYAWDLKEVGRLRIDWIMALQKRDKIERALDAAP